MNTRQRGCESHVQGKHSGWSKSGKGQVPPPPWKAGGASSPELSLKDLGTDRWRDEVEMYREITIMITNTDNCLFYPEDCITMIVGPDDKSHPT